MSLVFLSLAIAALWINLLGAGLAARRLVGDYALARATGPLAICMACFFAEYFWGWGPHLRLLPFTSAVSVWLIWRNRDHVRENLAMEALFGVGFFYCLAWRYTFPDIDFTEDKMPNFELIESYMRGTRLPPADLWMPPFPANNYYSFQHYCAALMGRLIGIGPGLSYHLAFCTLVGFMTLLAGSCFWKLCSWPAGRGVGVLSLLIGGSGIPVIAHILLKDPYAIDIVRFLGGSIVRTPATDIGKVVSGWMATPGLEARDLPMEPLSYYLTKGDYHPPLAGFLLLAFTAALIVAQEAGAQGRTRSLYHGLVAATVPIAFMSNAWILPLQCLLAGGWFVYCVVRGERGCLIPGFVGAAAATGLEFPFLLDFTQQAIGGNAAIGITKREDHTPLVGWLIVFWPIVGILVLGVFNRQRRPLALFLVAIWAVALFSTEFLFNHDIYGGAFGRFNSTLKWWQWVYAGIIMTLGALNLGSASRVCRYGTLILLLPGLAFAYDLTRQFKGTPKAARGHMSGTGWIDRDPVIKDLIAVLSHRPDGISIESGLDMQNTESPAVSLFSDKESYLGWPWLEGTWRAGFSEVNLRYVQIKSFYNGSLPDPLGWLLQGNISYILWLPRDNSGNNAQFKPLNDKIKSRYYWHHMYGNDKNFAIGFWERIDGGPEH
jgi:uncharacterized membrane protein